MKKKYILIFISILLLTGCKTKTYTVTFVNEDGTKLANVNIEKGDTLEDIDKPTKEGYIFVSWLKNGIEYDIKTPINEDITLTANWIETPSLTKKYTVTFNFGEELKTKTVEEGDKVEEPKSPKKEKHDFLGWYIGDTLYDFNNPVTKDLVIIAKFEKNRVVINFELDGGTGTTQKEIDKGSVLEKPKDPEKFGYYFTGWTLDGKEYDFSNKIDKDITLKANYEAIEYVKVKFDTDGGTTITPKLLEKGQKLTNIPTPVKEGYTFSHWMLEDKEFKLDSKVESSMTLKAIYIKNEQTNEPLDEEEKNKEEDSVSE